MEAFSGTSMGSRLRLLVHDARRAPDAWAAVEEVFAATAAALTRFEATSPLSALNARASSGEWVEVPDVLRAALVLARRAQRVTDGRFDPRVLAALELAGERAGFALPARDVRRADPWLEVRGRAVRLSAPVDLGGLGKGLALRLAGSRLRAMGIRHALLDAGGDVLALGLPGQDAGWRVGIEHPDGRPVPLVGLEVADAAVATSSVAVRRWTAPDATPAHHLIDPATGRPAHTGLVAVSVLHADPAWAEVHTKALFLAGADAIALEAERRSLAAWWVRDDGRVGASAAGARVERFRLRPLAA